MKINRSAPLAILLAATAIVACDKNGRQDITAPTSGAYVKFFNFGVGAPGVNFYVDTLKVTAISSSNCQPPNDTTTVCRTSGNESTTGTAYAAAGDGGLYAQVTPGQRTLAGKIAATTDKGLAIANVSTALTNGQYYSFYVSGIYNTTTKAADAFVIADTVPATIDYTQAYVRFVNAISNSSPMILYAKNQTTTTETAVGSAIAYKAAGGFTPLPAGVYDLNTRTAGSSTNLITRTSVSFSAGHVYTVTARGDMLATVTANKPALDNTANR